MIINYPELQTGNDTKIYFLIVRPKLSMMKSICNLYLVAIHFKHVQFTFYYICNVLSLDLSNQ